MAVIETLLTFGMGYLLGGGKSPLLKKVAEPDKQELPVPPITPSKVPWPHEEPIKKQAERRWKEMTPKEKAQAKKATADDQWGTDEELLKEAARRQK